MRRLGALFILVVLALAISIPASAGNHGYDNKDCKSSQHHSYGHGSKKKCDKAPGVAARWPVDTPGGGRSRPGPGSHL